MERSHAWRPTSKYKISSFNPFQGLWNVLTFGAKLTKKPESIVSIPFRDYGTFSRGEPLYGGHRVFCVSIPFRDYGTFSPHNHPYVSYLALFQSLSGIMERSHKNRPQLRLVMRLFQSLSGIMERSHACEGATRRQKIAGFNPFQGLWNVLTSNFREKISWELGFNPFQGLWNVLTYDPQTKRTNRRSFNPFQGLWNVLTMTSSGRWRRWPRFQSLSGIMERSHSN